MRTERAEVTMALAEMTLYALCLWASMEMAKSPDQRIQDRLKRYQRVYRSCWWLSRAIGRVAIAAELAYLRETL